jgi:hypothetical protein
MYILVFWIQTSCNLVCHYQSFVGTYCLLLQVRFISEHFLVKVSPQIIEPHRPYSDPRNTAAAVSYSSLVYNTLIELVLNFCLCFDRHDYSAEHTLVSLYKSLFVFLEKVIQLFGYTL